jgi:hypothetical protein
MNFYQEIFTLLSGERQVKLSSKIIFDKYFINLFILDLKIISTKP